MVNDRAYAFVVPNMRAWSNEEGLIRLINSEHNRYRVIDSVQTYSYRHQTNRAFGRMCRSGV